MDYWLLLEKSDETRVSKGIDGYRDVTGESYHYDSLVPNYKKIAKGDLIVLRKESEIIGVGTIRDISAATEHKSHRRCPKCWSTDIRERTTMLPRFRCGKCAYEFAEPKNSSSEVQSFVATIKDFTRLDAPPSVKAVKMCAEGRDGLSSQLSMLRLNPAKVQTLFEGVNLSPSPLSQTIDGSGQGFGLSHAERRAVKYRAMQVARRIYEAEGWKIVDVSSSQPFDFLATKGDDRKFIEVKGTTGAGRSVILTHGEVNHIRSNAKHSALIVVSGIVLERVRGGWEATGGTVTTHEDPWALLEANLCATQYRYNVPDQ